MIAKLIAYGADARARRSRGSRGALDGFVIRGVSHNIAFSRQRSRRAERFAPATLSTDFIAEEFPGGFKGETLAPEIAAHAVAVAAAAQRIAERARCRYCRRHDPRALGRRTGRIPLSGEADAT